MHEPVLTDSLLFDALECGLRLQYDALLFSKQAPGTIPESSGEIKSALYRKLLKVFTQAEGIEEKSSDELSEWLNGSEPGAFFDLAIRHDEFKTTLPLLFRDQNGNLFIVQFQGRRWSKKDRHLKAIDLLQPKIKKYVQRLAFRYTLFCAAYPEVSPPVPLLVFPSSAYRKSPELTIEDVCNHSPSRDIFVKVEILERVLDLLTLSQIPAEPLVGMEQTESGSSEINLSHVDPMQWIYALKDQIFTDRFLPGKHCFTCRYRKKIPGLADGCWQQQTDTKELTSPHLQIPDLPGHGNLSLIEDGILFQEHATKVSTDAHQPFTLQWRRAKQIELASVKHAPLQEREVIHPTLWDRLNELRFPLHFLDFEAASFPVSPGFPSKPYTPVLFQYSCHTIVTPEDLLNGHIHHHDWIDRDLSADPEVKLLTELFTVDHIFEGTVFHYAPFERQHLMKLFTRSQHETDKQWSQLGESLKIFTQSKPGASRFIDLAEWVSRYYFHEKLDGKLGLKDLYHALLAENSIDIDDETDIPYQDRVKNGEHAMHIYLALRTGVLNPSAKDYWMNRLLAYCSLDTLVMARALVYWTHKLQ